MTEVVQVSKETYDWLVKELAKPPKTNERLKALFQSPSPWENESSTKNDQ